MSAITPVIRSLSVRNYNPDRLREVINGADLEHTILDPQNCDATIHQWRCADLSIDSGFYSFPVFVQGQFAPRHLCVGISQGRSEATWVNGATLDRSSIQVYAEDTEMLYRAGPRTDWAGITITRELLQKEALKRLGHEIDLPISGMRNYQTAPLLIDRLMRSISTMNRGEDAGANSVAARKEKFLQLLLECLFSSGNEGALRQIESRQQLRLDIVRRADAVIRQKINEGDGYSSEFICRNLGVSERSLQMHFKEAMGMPPKTWFRRVAMNEAHRVLTLEQPRPGLVAQVAMDHHFEHLGRFSQEYRKLFGESPSETARRLAPSRDLHFTLPS
ncbi:MAG: helix-turn-helix domain-containing protein [Verrucomicrobiales bacterium]|nr:helix-turn-helix domain-containing protein [Verrucomicrobiales bacterium]